MEYKQGFQPMMKDIVLVSAVLACCVLPAVADHKVGQDRDPVRDRDSRDRVRDVTEIVLSEVLFGDRDRRILDDYLRSERYEAPRKKHKKLPPGLRKKLARDGQLPPGWQKKMSRWDVMDDAVYRQSTRLPEHIARQLSGSPTGTSIRRVEDRIVRVMDATHTILDVLSAGSRDY